MSIYEVHLGSWRTAPHKDLGHRWLTYRELAEQLVPYVKEMGFTHIQLMPPTNVLSTARGDTRPSATLPQPRRFGTPDDFRHFIDTAHQAGLGVIMDWVPRLFPKTAMDCLFSTAPTSTNTPTHARANTKTRTRSSLTTGETEVSASSFQVWLEKYHIDAGPASMPWPRCFTWTIRGSRVR